MSPLISSRSISALTALVLLLAGCGEAGSSSSAAALSKAEFVTRADAICGKTRQALRIKVQEFVRKHPRGFDNLQPEIEKDRLILAFARPLVQKEAEKLAALPAPEGDEKKVAAIVAALEAGIKKTEEDPLSTVAGTYREAIKLATAYGISQCYEIA